MSRALIGLGSNLDNPRDQVVEALQELSETDGIRLLARSSLYLSEPLGPQDQPDFINAAAAIETTLEPLSLLEVLQAIEQRHGRKRERHWGPRTLDLDLLLYDDEQIRHPDLTVPHPAIAERSFVLLPLQEIAPGLVIPGLGSVESLLEKLGNPVLEITNDV
ncbi:MAG: 2-amino-4-hydroxy-6-hydroxymethyldihydropteridine diphosphokinase [Sedimenticolaceae bacterium]|nr:2-amino-4-hydroxy-6-hydroxymethyldihydropteridine diphosphokinase [Sedimenticolaceae bacterium]